MEIPDLAEGDFEHLTVSRQLRLLEKFAGKSKSTLIGSSLGGYLAALYAARHPERVDRLVLLAPAFGFHQLWTANLGPERLESWKRAGSVNVFHYGEGRELPLAYDFLDDAAQYEAFPDANQPALLLHGNQDSVVPVEQSAAFVGLHPQARLVRYTSGHELSNVLESMWYETEAFLLGRQERPESDS